MSKQFQMLDAQAALGFGETIPVPVDAEIHFRIHLPRFIKSNNPRAVRVIFNARAQGGQMDQRHTSFGMGINDANLEVVAPVDGIR